VITYTPVIESIALLPHRLVDVLRLDKIHPVISGNKWFKLKHNVLKAKAQGKKTILTFGGAHSNHLAAAAEACKLYGLNSIAIVRGEDSRGKTLRVAEAAGMRVVKVSRSDYARKNETEYLAFLQDRYGDCYVIPEGGNNADGIRGCMDILAPLNEYDYVCCACGTGATFAGLVASTKNTCIPVGISVLKGPNRLAASVQTQLQGAFPDKQFKVDTELSASETAIPCVLNTYAFSGFAAHDPFLVTYKNTFEQKHGITLDYLYTTKLFYATEDLLSTQKIPENARVLVIHSGGLQGNEAFEQRYGIETAER
jgi:1-aminocyclopropane-1-carboxylate deaminase